MFLQSFVPRHARESYRWDSRAAWLFGLFAGFTVPFFGVIARRMGASNFEMEMLVASTAIGNVIAMFVACLMQSRQKMPYLFWLNSVARGLLVLMAFATTRFEFVALVFASQLLGCLAGPAYAMIMKDAYPDDCRGQVMGTVRIGLTLAAMVAGLYAGKLMASGLPWWWVVLFTLGAAFLIAHEVQGLRNKILVGAGVIALGLLSIPLLSHQLDYRVVFPVGGILGVLSMWMFSHMYEKPVPPPEVQESALATMGQYFHNLGKMFRVPIVDWRFGLYCLAFLVFGFGNWLRSPLVPMLQVDALNISDATVGMLAMVSSAASIGAYIAWGWLMDRFNPFFTLLAAFLLQGLVPVFFAYVAPDAHAVPIMVVASVVQGLVGPGIELSALNAVLHFSKGEDIPIYMALHNFMVGIRGVIAPFLGTEVLLHMFRNETPLQQLHSSFIVSAWIVWAGFVLMVPVVLLAILPEKKRMAKLG